MRSKILIALILTAFSLLGKAQVVPSAERGHLDLSVGGGIDDWKADYDHISRVGPSAWATSTIWHGFGLIAEGHSMMAGGNAPEFKYFEGGGGPLYTFYRWNKWHPYIKGEAGYARLSVPHRPTSTYYGDTRTTYSLGGGFEYRIMKRVWARFDYTYDAFPDFQSFRTGQHHTVDPTGFAAGATYHFR